MQQHLNNSRFLIISQCFAVFFLFLFFCFVLFCFFFFFFFKCAWIYLVLFLFFFVCIFYSLFKRLALWVKFSADIVKPFSQETGFDILCKLSLLETICMNCQNLFSMKNKKIS